MNDYIVVPCDRDNIRGVVEANHYSGSINGVISDYCFALLYKGQVVGGMIFGRVAMHNAWKKYAERESDITELRRLACIDDTPPNTESFFIGKALRWLSQNTDLKIVVSYADANYNHSGIIYRASNFEYLGLTPSGRVIEYRGKKFHDKAIRTKYKGVIKPFAQEIKNALETGEAKYVEQVGKHIFVYKLKQTPKKQRVLL